MTDNPGFTIEGEYPDIDHVKTGCMSMDYALGNKDNIGMPDRTIYEISGHPHVGKSTLAYFLSSAFGSENTYLCDLEGFDKSYVFDCLKSAEFQGTLHVIAPVTEKKKEVLRRTHEEMLMDACRALMDTPGKGTIIVDSVGAIVPIMEAEGDFGEAFIGRRAKLVAQLSRRLTGIMIDRPDPCTAIIVNHQHQIIGGQGHTTPGGETLKFLAGCRINVWNKDTIKTTDDTILGYLMQGTVDKLRYGGKGRKFYAVNLSGQGISRDLTAMFDCFLYELAVRDTMVKIGDKAIGKISKLFKDAAAGRHEVFLPFYEALEEYESTHKLFDS